MLTFKTMEIATKRRIFRWGYTPKQKWWFDVWSIGKSGQRRHIDSGVKLKSEEVVLLCLIKSK